MKAPLHVTVGLCTLLVTLGSAYAGDFPDYRQREQREYEMRKEQREPAPAPAPCPACPAVTERQWEDLDDEIQLNGGFFHALGSDIRSYDLDAAYGRFLNDQLELGVRQGVNVTTRDDLRDQWIATTTGFGLFHLQFDESQRLIPFAGGFAGAAYNDQDAAPVLGPTAGLRVYPVPSTFVQAGYRYEWFPGDIEIAEDDANANHVATLGIGYRF